MPIPPRIVLPRKLVRKFLNQVSYIRTEDRSYVSEWYRCVLDYIVQPGRCDLGFVAPAFSNEFGHFRKMFGVRLVRALAALSQFALAVQNQAMSQFGEPSRLLYELFGHPDHVK